MSIMLIIGRAYIIIFLLAVWGCADTDDQSRGMPLTGNLIYGIGSSLYSISLASGQKRLLVTRSGGALQDGLTRISDQTLLVGGSGDLVEYDSLSGRLTKVGKGWYPLALTSLNTVFFYMSRSGRPNILFRAPIRDPSNDLIQVEGGPYRYPFPIIQISSNEIIFLGGDNSAIRFGGTTRKAARLISCFCQGVGHVLGEVRPEKFCAGTSKNDFITFPI
jgi:hypothetical protein